MSFEAAAWAIKQKTNKPIEKLVLIALADCYNKHNSRCDPSVLYLSQIAICSARQVTRSINELITQGFISVVRNHGLRTRFNINMTPDPQSPHPRLTVTPTPDSQSETPDSQSPKPVVTSNKTSNVPDLDKHGNEYELFIVDESVKISLRLACVNLTDQMLADFQLRMRDWQDKGNTQVNRRNKFLHHCIGIKNGKGGKDNSTLEQRLNDTSWADGV